MKLGNPIRITDGVFQLRALGARVTVLTAGGEAMLIDAGMRGSSALILGGLDAMGLSLDAVKTLVITHRHPDHAAGVGELIDGRDVVVMAHPLEAGILSGWEDHPSPFQNKLVATGHPPSPRHVERESHHRLTLSWRTGTLSHSPSLYASFTFRGIRGAALRCTCRTRRWSS